MVFVCFVFSQHVLLRVACPGEKTILAAVFENVIFKYVNGKSCNGKTKGLAIPCVNE